MVIWGAGRPAFESKLCYSPTVWPWEIGFIFLNLNFPFSTTKKVIPVVKGLFKKGKIMTLKQMTKEHMWKVLPNSVLISELRRSCSWFEWECKRLSHVPIGNLEVHFRMDWLLPQGRGCHVCPLSPTTARAADRTLARWPEGWAPRRPSHFVSSRFPYSFFSYLYV